MVKELRSSSAYKLVFSLPDFEVIVEKGSGKKVWINCQYNLDDEAHEDDDPTANTKMVT